MNAILPALRSTVCAATLAGAILLCSAGCASTAEKPTGPLVAEVVPPGVVTKDYKYITRLGSHIPIRVPKNGVTRPAPGASPVETLSPEILTEIVNRPSGR